MTNPFQSILDAQQANFLSDATKSYAWRIDQLDRMERMLAENRAALCAALHDDFGKPPFEQLFEISVPTGVIRYYRDNLKALMTPEPVRIPEGLETTGNRGVIYKEPYGVTLVIGPFNAPILLLLDPAIAALAAGNTVVLKPANTTPKTAFGAREMVFAGCYVAMQVGRTGFIVWQLGRAHALADNYRRMLGWLVISGCFWIGGAFADGGLRASRPGPVAHQRLDDRGWAPRRTLPVVRHRRARRKPPRDRRDAGGSRDLGWRDPVGDAGDLPRHYRHVVAIFRDIR